MDTLFFIVFLLLFALVLYIGSRQKSRKRSAGKALAEKQSTNEDPPMFTGGLDRSDAIFDVFIAGLAHHCSAGDVGVFQGFIYNDSWNAVDRNAMAIWSNRKSAIVGYVPAPILDEYRKWSEGRKCLCVGVIYWNGDSLRGRARAYANGLEDESIKDDMARFTASVSAHFGWPTDKV